MRLIDLSDKHAIVCGSTQGMGQATAHEMARLGARVSLVARDPSALKRAVGELDTGERQAHAYVCQDFTDPAALQAKISEHLRAHGPAHILVNNTGGPPGGPILEALPDEFLTAYGNHVICNQLLVQSVVPGMKAEGFGRIINIISSSAKTPIPGLGVSNTTRGAVASWAKTLAGELGPFGITVNNVLPGFIDTARIYDVIHARAGQLNRPAEDIQREFIAQVPAGRFGRPEEVAAVIAFLASPAAAYVNGINLPVDGGRTPTL